jgi:hypothetical protein
MEFLSDNSLGSIALVILLFALVLTFGFEFVNGFHDTANAVATVIYTNALTPGQAVVWSGLWNFLGVVVSSGAVAFAIVALLPIELILHVRSEAAFAMVMALLLSAIIWNVGTWYLGLPASSSHTLDRLDRWSRPDELADRRPWLRRGRELGQGRGDRVRPGDLADDRFHRGGGRTGACPTPDPQPRSPPRA